MPPTIKPSVKRSVDDCATGNKSVPKIIINYTIYLFLNCNQDFANFKP